MSLNPLSTTELISRRYLNYLQTTFQFNDRELDTLFREAIKKHQFTKGPIIEATPPFKKGCSIQQLINEGILSPLFQSLNPNALPLDRSLYLHQEQAIRRTVQDRRNIVVATGTGSGKTEIFIIALLNELFRQKESGKLGPGVRALLLYPMNALVNDQLKRMRELLSTCPDITFGRYTGETLEKQARALEKFDKIFDGKKPLPNERISREAMRNAPPHILLTNYAMLEYLLLRPYDNCFFDGVFAQDWAFIILDEAHTYNGAKGIEMAMLLRRLKDRVVESDPCRLRCIATSATLGGSEGDYQDVALFVHQIFGEQFSADDVIGAIREEVTSTQGWGKPEPELYTEFSKNLADYGNIRNVQKLFDIGLRHGVPRKILDTSRNAYEAHLDVKDATNAFLFYMLQGDDRLLNIKMHLAKKPDFFDNICNILCSSETEREPLVALVELTGKACRNPSDNPLLSARYHLFIRTVEGAYIQFFPKKKIYLTPTKTIEDTNHAYPVFELASCRYCGTPFLVGMIDNSEGIPKLKQQGSYLGDDNSSILYFLLSSQDISRNDDEDDEVEMEGKIQNTGEKYILCGHCGSIDKESRVKPVCSCGKEYQVPLIFIDTGDNNLQKCPFCNKLSPRTSVVSRFFFGRDAIPSVLATAIYQELPDIISGHSTHDEELHKNVDPWTPVVTSPIEHSSGVPLKKDKKRNLLVFSDSRSDAAFFAPYLNQTYDKIIRRALLIQVIQEKKNSILKEHWRITDFLAPLKDITDQYGFLSKYTPAEKKREINRWLMHEFVFGNNRGSLEDLGLCGFKLIKPSDWRAPGPLLQEPWNLSEDEAWILFQVLLDHFRTSCAIRFPEGISPTEEFFQPRNFQFYFRGSGSSPTHHIMSWSPKAKYPNKRLDFLCRLTEKFNPDISEDSCRDTLEGIWRFIKNSTILLPYFVQESLGNEGEGTLMKPECWEVTSALIDPDTKWYECNRCHNLTLHNIRSVCPTYRCNGILHPVNPNVLKRENHYRILYTEMDPIVMRAEEHTAQLSHERATELQQEFLDGKVNVLSCSTTFELGVDVGELEAVFMRNMPPTAANYIQRAGRAGRRVNSAAFVTTFCQQRSHDLTHFKDPMQFVKGIIKPPFFELENEKIVKRHVFATAIAAFWRRYPETFKDVDEFFFNTTFDVPATFLSFLKGHPPDLEAALFRIVPEQLHVVLDLPHWGFIEDLYYEGDISEKADKGLMTKARNGVVEEIKDLDEVYRERTGKKEYSEHIRNLIKTIKKRPIINYLSSHNIIPKYGFPVDVVELQIMYASENAKKIDLQRDLKIALSEYAPGSQVVAAGFIWESAYIKRNPKRDWLKYRYVICDSCYRYHCTLSEINKDLTFCEACKADLSRSKKKGEFIIPEFGFMSSSAEPKRVTEKRPDKTYSTRAYFSGECRSSDSINHPFNNGVILRAETASHGKLAVINDARGSEFRVCMNCGYSIPGYKKIPNSHRNAFDRKCGGKFMKVALGHQYLTDILMIEFEGYSNKDQNFWLSLLYALLEGLSQSLGINRTDIDGCLYPVKGKLSEPSIILFDNVPGGAGHVKRAIQKDKNLLLILKATFKHVTECKCGEEQGHCSCYGCLKNYNNQFCHEYLDRRLVIDFFEYLGIQKG